jgi:hypothetical protein
MELGMVGLIEYFLYLDEVQDGVGHAYFKLAVYFFLTNESVTWPFVNT